MSLDLLSSSDSSPKEGAYLNEKEGPSLPEANSIIYPPTPGYHLFTPEGCSEVKVVTSVTTSQMDAIRATGRNRQERMGNIG